jgi:hypothetical protein
MHQQTLNDQTTLPVSSIDLKPIVEHGESPTAIILAIAFLLTTLFGSVTKLIQAILIRR